MLAPIMVIGKPRTIKLAMKHAELTAAGLADKMNVSHRTVENILAGRPIGSRTQIALHEALGDYSPGVVMFQVVVEKAEV